jgi:uncharacterized protein YdiU (UPF0061 family)
MAAVSIPTTRSLCILETGETIRRDRLLPGAILVRLAKTHIRIGTFEYAASTQQHSLGPLKELTDYTIKRLYPHLVDQNHAYFEFFKEVSRRQVRLVSQWMSVGFIHGVMNTDNMSVGGETLDYGPCAFMDHFKYSKVFSSIDHYGRYAYGNQLQILMWNLDQLAKCLQKIDPDHDYGQWLQLFYQEGLEVFVKTFCEKFGLLNLTFEEGLQLLQTWFRFLEQHQLDFTLAHLDLEKILLEEETHVLLKTLAGFEDVYRCWQQHLINEGRTIQEVLSQMRKKNPYVIPRNHHVEKAIEDVYRGDRHFLDSLLRVIQRPFLREADHEHFFHPPRPEEVVHQTFCGT